MEYFLERIAKSLYSGYGNRLNTQCLVFPNRRAGLFFQKYLSAELERPVWSPAIMTINDLFSSLSKLQKAENEILLFELYKVYLKIKKSQESFDDFYFWGDMLLNDFDDVDKYLIDASKLFHNVQDISKIDEQFGGLTQEQIEIIKRFWVNLNTEKLTREKTEFINIWSLLNDLYFEFRRILTEKNLAYEGLIFREVIENHNEKTTTGITWDMVHFIGFNALNECEKVLMTRLKKEDRAMFYWDYDNSYIKGSTLNSAGFFLRDNIRIFGNDMPEEWNYDTLLSRKPEKSKKCIINTSSDVAQVKLIPHLIKEMQGITPENAHNTAIILADENLLIPLLTSLPENIADINITMGYPLKQTSVYLFVKQMLELQLNVRIENGVVLFSRQDVMKVLKNSFINPLTKESGNAIINEIIERNLLWIPSGRFVQSEILSSIFRKPSSPSLISDYLKTILSLINSNDREAEESEKYSFLQNNIRNELIYRVILSLNRLDAVAKSPEISLKTDTWIRMLDRLLRSQSVPFSGEPLSGIQIMGILETRTLDFKNLIILSVNEGILPSVTTSSSFIPFSLREAFGLPSINHQESIYAYHFYRLLHRAENITFIYNSDSEGLRSGEMSRFLQQIKYESPVEPEFINLSFEIKNRGSISKIVERTKEHNIYLISYFEDTSGKKILSPTAINTWLNCRMRFYYRYVNGLKEPDILSKEIDPAMLGILLHKAMKNLYGRFVGKQLDSDIVNSLITDRKALSQLISDAITDNFKRENDSMVAGNELIIRDVLLEFINRVLLTDRKETPFTIVAVEKQVTFPVSVMVDGHEVKVSAGGIIDRLDLKDGVIRIVDYKTGKTADSISSINDLFKDDRKKDNDAWLQTLLYCEGYLNENEGVKVRPSVYKIKKVPSEDISDKLRIKAAKNAEYELDDYNIVRQEFINNFKNIVRVIFDQGEPFAMTSDIYNKCSFCPYRNLCMR